MIFFEIVVAGAELLWWVVKCSSIYIPTELQNKIWRERDGKLLLGIESEE